MVGKHIDAGPTVTPTNEAPGDATSVHPHAPSDEGGEGVSWLRVSLARGGKQKRDVPQGESAKDVTANGVTAHLSYWRKQVHQLMGRRLARRRKELGWSQKQLAEKVHVSRERIAQYETGRVGVDSGDLPLLANALRVPLLWFYVDDNAVLVSAAESTLSEILHALPFRDRTLLLDIANTIYRRYQAESQAERDGEARGPEAEELRREQA